MIHLSTLHLLEPPKRGWPLERERRSFQIASNSVQDRSPSRRNLFPSPPPPQEWYSGSVINIFMRTVCVYVWQGATGVGTPTIRIVALFAPYWPPETVTGRGTRVEKLGFDRCRDQLDSRPRADPFEITRNPSDDEQRGRKPHTLSRAPHSYIFNVYIYTKVCPSLSRYLGIRK